MKTMILAAFAALSLGFAVAPVAANAASLFGTNSSVSDDAGATRFQQTGVYE